VNVKLTRAANPLIPNDPDHVLQRAAFSSPSPDPPGPGPPLPESRRQGQPLPQTTPHRGHPMTVRRLPCQGACPVGINAGPACGQKQPKHAAAGAPEQPRLHDPVLRAARCCRACSAVRVPSAVLRRSNAAPTASWAARTCARLLLKPSSPGLAGNRPANRPRPQAARCNRLTPLWPGATLHP
jgi:hypothetical protein